MIQHSIKHKLALVGACLLTFMSAQAQTADGTVVISGQVSANTCKLSITDTNGSTNNGICATTPSSTYRCQFNTP
jgi:type 1 fimbria pilin